MQHTIQVKQVVATQQQCKAKRNTAHNARQSKVMQSKLKSKAKQGKATQSKRKSKARHGPCSVSCAHAPLSQHVSYAMRRNAMHSKALQFRAMLIPTKPCLVSLFVSSSCSWTETELWLCWFHLLLLSCPSSNVGSLTIYRAICRWGILIHRIEVV